MSDKTYNYRGYFISQRADGYLNATQMCKAHGKFIAKWTSLKATKSFLFQLAGDLNVEPKSLIITIQGGEVGNKQRQQGTWVHPLACINLANWLHPSFGIWCFKHIDLKSMDKPDVKILDEPIEPKSVYLIYSEATQLTKIGISDDVERRVNTLQNQCGVPLKVIFQSNKSLDSHYFEKCLHEEFKEKRKLGEWFNLSEKEVSLSVKLLKEGV